MSLLDQALLDKIENGSKEDAIAAAQEAGKTYTPLWFDYRDSEWETALGFLKVKTEEGISFPAFNFAGYFPDNTEPLKEIRRAARENPLFAATDEGDEALQEVKDAFQDSVDEHFDPEKPVKDMIKSIRQNLAVFVPILPGSDVAVPQARISGCDTQSDEWKALVAWTQNHVLDTESKRPCSVILPELAGNASYGGEPGIVVNLDGKDFLRWIEEKDLWKVLQGFGTTQCSLAIYDFCNGSGHDAEGTRIDWKKLQRPEGARLGIINNFIDAVFGLVGISSVHIPSTFPNKGSGCYANIWF